MLDSTDPGIAAAPEASERSLVADLRQLADDARAVAQAEAAYQKSRAAFATREAKGIAALGGLALALGFFALMALTLGLVLALTPILTAWGATAVVFGTLVACAALCAWLAANRWRRMAATLSDERES